MSKLHASCAVRSKLEILQPENKGLLLDVLVDLNCLLLWVNFCSIKSIAKSFF